jgi:de-etiolated-1
VYEVDCPD